MDKNILTPLKLLIISSILYIVISIIATGMAISENRPAEFGGTSTNLSVVQDFLYGQGTAMSPPLYWLVIQALLTIIATRRNFWGVVGVTGLAIFGLLSGIGALGEPIIKEIFSLATFDLVKVIVQAGMIAIPFLFMAFAIMELIRRIKNRKIASVDI